MTPTMSNNELRELRRIAGLTQAKLGNLLGLSQASISMMELEYTNKNYRQISSDMERKIRTAIKNHLDKRGKKREEVTTIDTRPAPSEKSQLWKKIAELETSLKTVNKNLQLQAMWIKDLNERLRDLSKPREDQKAFLKSLAPEQKNFLTSLSPRECCALLDYLNKKGTNDNEKGQN